MAQRSTPDPKGRILDAAERAFADHGLEGASMRDIVREAGVNLATVYYHFDSKDGLMAAVLERRFNPLQEEHLAALRQLEAAAGRRPVPLEQLIGAMLAPPLRLSSTPTAEARNAIRLIGRVVNDPNPRTQKLLQRQHHGVREAFLAALRRTVPQLAEPDLQWRFQFFWGALALVLCNPAKLEVMTGGLCDLSDTESLQDQMVACFAAGFRAPSAAGRRSAGAVRRQPTHRRR